MNIIDKPRPVSEQAQDIAEESFQELLATLGDVSPEVSNLVRQKYEEDEQEFRQAVADCQPSSEPSYWAKKTCRKCHGRGIIGKQHFFVPGQPARSHVDPETGKKVYVNSAGQMDIKCACTGKAYKKWLTDFRLYFNMLKAQTVAWKLEKEQEGENNET